MNTPTLSLPPRRGRVKVRGRNKKTTLAYGKKCKEECEVKEEIKWLG